MSSTRCERACCWKQKDPYLPHSIPHHQFSRSVSDLSGLCVLLQAKRLQGAGNAVCVCVCVFLCRSTDKTQKHETACFCVSKNQREFLASILALINTQSSASHRLPGEETDQRVCTTLRWSEMHWRARRSWKGEVRCSRNSEVRCSAERGRGRGMEYGRVGGRSSVTGVERYKEARKGWGGAGR